MKILLWHARAQSGIRWHTFLDYNTLAQKKGANQNPGGDANV